MSASAIPRRTVLAGAAALLAAAGMRPARAADAPKPSVVRIGVVNSDVSGEPFYADAGGFYKRAGIEAQIQPLSGGGAIIDAVANGEV
ncbi:MAG: hypothetical protein ABR591_08175, partial [Candidatus Velthaea sp.]